MAEGGIADDAAVEVERGDGRGVVRQGRPAGIEELAAAAPELEGEVVEGVVAVGESGEDGAVETRGRIGEEAGDLLRTPPMWRAARGRGRIANERLRGVRGRRRGRCDRRGTRGRRARGSRRDGRRRRGAGRGSAPSRAASRGSGARCCQGCRSSSAPLARASASQSVTSRARSKWPSRRPPSAMAELCSS